MHCCYTGALKEVVMRHIFKRMPGNINAKVEPIGDLEDMVRQIICDMEETVCNARQNAAIETSNELKLEIIRMGRELDELKQTALDLGIWKKAA